MTHPLLRDRWSPSILDPSYDLTQVELEELLTAAQWAPSKGNTQPWAFVVCPRGSANHDLVVPLLSRGNSWWVPRASLVLIALVQVAEGPEPGSPPYSEYAEYDLGQAAAHLTLEARALGLEAHQFAGFDHDGAADVFDLPAHLRPRSGIAVGRRATPDQIAAAPERERQREQRERVRRPLRLF